MTIDCFIICFDVLILKLLTLSREPICLKMVFGWIYVNNKAVVYGRFVKQTKEFIKKTGVDKILLTEDKEEGKEDFLTCGAFGRTECVIAALDLMKDEAGCRKSLVGIVLFNWNDRNVEIL